MEDISAGKEENKLRVVNGWNDDQLGPFEYITSVEVEPPELFDHDLTATAEGASSAFCASPGNGPIVNFCAKGFCSCPDQHFCQRSFTPPRADSFEVFYANPMKKWALRTRRALPEDCVLFEYGGVLREDGGEEVEQDDYLFTFAHIGRHFVVDACAKGNLARFVNHSCAPNCFTKLALIGPGPVPHLLICASRKILKGEELTLDYGEQWWQAKRAEGVVCHCGELTCRYGSAGDGNDKIEEGGETERTERPQ